MWLHLLKNQLEATLKTKAENKRGRWNKLDSFFAKTGYLIT
jgi:hypothetical protein